MTGPDTGPLIPRRRLGAAFRSLRDARGETLQQTAAAVMFSPSKLSRIENGIAGEPHPRDVRDLLDHFAVSGSDRTPLDALAEDARRPGWWQVPPYDMPATLDAYISYESAADDMEGYYPVGVPGLLQTPAYAAALISRTAPHLSPAAVAEQVDLRLERRRRLDARDHPPNQRYTLPESVLLRAVGDPAVMREQLDSLAVDARRPHIGLHIIPFARGVYEAVELPSTTLFHFDSTDDPDVVAIERLRYTDFSDKPKTIQKYRRAFIDAQHYRLDESESSEFLERARREKWTDR